MDHLGSALGEFERGPLRGWGVMVKGVHRGGSAEEVIKTDKGEKVGIRRGIWIRNGRERSGKTERVIERTSTGKLN